MANFHVTHSERGLVWKADRFGAIEDFAVFEDSININLGLRGGLWSNKHYKPSAQYDPSNDNAPVLGLKTRDVIHMMRSSLDRNYPGYNDRAAQNPREQQALQNLTCCLEQGERLRSLQLAPRLLQEMFEAVDDYFFRGMLKKHITIRQARIGDYGVTMSGTSRLTKHLLKKKGVRIDITDGSISIPGNTFYEKFQFILGTIMHEACHAVFFLYTCTCMSCLMKLTKELGISGHGPAWMEIAQAVVNRARKSRRLKRAGGDHVGTHEAMNNQQGAGKGLLGAFFGRIAYDDCIRPATANQLSLSDPFGQQCGFDESD
ncbi:MAG: hypothetical protein M1814_000816 [Vezdaea aestivalis]|nr:MAG: hypothetical protein M1814_000816 [Vezdaea aestivalis]